MCEFCRVVGASSLATPNLGFPNNDDLEFDLIDWDDCTLVIVGEGDTGELRRV
jgi:hypothetical protein